MGRVFYAEETTWEGPKGTKVLQTSVANVWWEKGKKIKLEEQAEGKSDEAVKAISEKSGVYAM